MIALNPFAFRLERHDCRFYEIKTKPVYKNGEYSTYKYADRYFVTCRGNIIVTETTNIPKDLIEHLVACKVPVDYSKHHYRRILDAYSDGLSYAAKVNFEVING